MCALVCVCVFVYVFVCVCVCVCVLGVWGGVCVCVCVCVLGVCVGGVGCGELQQSEMEGMNGHRGPHGSVLGGNIVLV